MIHKAFWTLMASIGIFLGGLATSYLIMVLGMTLLFGDRGV